mmetsp:Transcript_25191/g.86323  ORF Transcript_25191/g.86323 Transcript_25191/m.86323 type:complete len:223 (-) Transcript_25191:2160-2828(-)
MGPQHRSPGRGSVPGGRVREALRSRFPRSPRGARLAAGFGVLQALCGQLNGGDDGRQRRAPRPPRVRRRGASAGLDGLVPAAVPDVCGRGQSLFAHVFLQFSQRHPFLRKRLAAGKGGPPGVGVRRLRGLGLRRRRGCVYDAPLHRHAGRGRRGRPQSRHRRRLPVVCRRARREGFKARPRHRGRDGQTPPQLVPRKVPPRPLRPLDELVGAHRRFGWLEGV